MKLEDFGLSIGTVRRLKRAGWNTVGDVVNAAMRTGCSGEMELLKYRGVGRTTVWEFMSRLDTRMRLAIFFANAANEPRSEAE